MKRYREIRSKIVFWLIRLFPGINIIIILLSTFYLAKIITSGFAANHSHSSYKETYSASSANNTNNTDSTNSTNSTQIDDTYLVAIDAGHGGIDPGSNGDGMFEKDVNLDICLRLNEILKEAGINTYMIRSDDRFIDHRKRVRMANQKNAALYLSIHCDWFVDSSCNGTQTLYYPSEDLKKGNLLEKEYAQIMQKSLIDALQTNDRGLMPNTKLAVFKYAEMPSVLIEIGFLSNKNNGEQLKSDSFKQKTAEALAQGIRKALLKIK